ncbi:MAG TPA: endo-1,4-beta-xylanase [Tepidisphaeraceae bacterium]|nr:endo-1,4-beta-xylanase [Tepidisphaeraceae bacterium]
MRMAPTGRILGSALLLLTLARASAAGAASLREAAGDKLLIGTAVSSRQLDNAAEAKLIAVQFSSATAENELKPDQTEPRPGQFRFEAGDRIAEFAQQHQIAIIGHTLCWHQQTPRWMFQNDDGTPLPREQALANLRTHITGVMGHFRGKVHGWDVVNEALSMADNGPELRDTPALRAIGDDYIEQAFRFAHEADPDVELYYNDFGIEQPAKRDRAIRLVRRLRAAGVRVDAVGIQGHWSLKYPPASTIDEAIRAYRDAGIKVMITELDIDVLPRRKRGPAIQGAVEAHADPYHDGCPPDVLAEQATRYADLFRVFLKYPDTITRVTLWGIHDGRSWLNYYPVRGRTNYPLLWDRQLTPKPALGAVLDVLEHGK